MKELDKKEIEIKDEELDQVSGGYGQSGCKVFNMDKLVEAATNVLDQVIPPANKQGKL